MNDSEFASLCANVLDGVESAIDAGGVDIDCRRKSATLLELEFGDGSRVVVNGQAPMRQIWVAARSGGHHFDARDGAWRDTRSGEALAATLTRVIREQGGVELRF
jgi:CyaY protein